jgi:hypothetical protein
MRRTDFRLATGGAHTGVMGLLRVLYDHHAGTSRTVLRKEAKTTPIDPQTPTPVRTWWSAMIAAADARVPFRFDVEPVEQAAGQRLLDANAGGACLRRLLGRCSPAQS